MALNGMNSLLLIAGILSHLFYFNQGEHHMYGAKYIQIFSTLFISAIITAIALLHESFGDAIIHISSLAFSYLAGVYTSLLIYRLSFGPLHAFPGPLGARISNFWFSSQLANHHAYEKVVKLHRQYGDFVRIGSNDISTIHPLAVNAIYGPGSKCTKSDWYDINLPMVSMQTTRQHTVHDKRRRIWSNAFGDKALRGYEDRIKIFQDKLIARIASCSDPSVNVTKYFGLYSFDVMGDLAFGTSFEMLTSDEEHWAIKLLHKGLEPVGFLFPTWFFRVVISIPRLMNDWWRFINYCAQMLDQRMTMTPNIPDIMSALLESYKNTKPTKEDMEMLKGDSQLMIVAGSDTVASTLVHTFFQLARNPEHISKLRDELARHIGRSEEIVDQKLQNAEHLNGVIFEVLRLHPPVPTALPRLTPSEGLQVDGTHIPGNVTIWCSQYAIGRSERVYENASSFIPERWYSDLELIHERSAFAPFSVGRYGCIGRPLAMLNLRTTVAKLLLDFDIGFPPGDDGSGAGFEARCKEHFTLAPGALNLVFRKRQVN